VKYRTDKKRYKMKFQLSNLILCDTHVENSNRKSHRLSYKLLYY
jgi:hypothetical protein